jgi:signal transduction histidine kinase
MDSARLGRVFEPLYTTKPQGLGIGLSICRSIVTAHGGQISARSVAGEGSSFTFTLPMRA